MRSEIKAALITGGCTILAAIIAIIPIWNTAKRSGEAAAHAENQLILQERYDTGYSDGYDDGIKVNAGGRESGTDGTIATKPPLAADPMPVDFYELSPYIVGQFDLSTRTNIKDNMGNIYLKTFIAYMSVADGGQSNTYDIGGEFTLLKGIAAIRTGCESSTYYGYIKIFGDGKLLWSKTDFSAATKPLEVVVDVSGVTDLTIEMAADGNRGYNGLHILFADITLE